MSTNTRPAEGGIGTILLLDDEPIDQAMYRRMIIRSGMAENVLSFLRPTEALAFLEYPDHPKIDVIVVDINMPCMSGFDFLRAATAAFGAEFTDIPAIMLTTSLDPLDRAEAMTFAMIRDYFKKPLTEAHLVRMTKIVKADRRASEKRPMLSNAGLPG